MNRCAYLKEDENGPHPDRIIGRTLLRAGRAVVLPNPIRQPPSGRHELAQNVRIIHLHGGKVFPTASLDLHFPKAVMQRNAAQVRMPHESSVSQI